MSMKINHQLCSPETLKKVIRSPSVTYRTATMCLK